MKMDELFKRKDFDMNEFQLFSPLNFKNDNNNNSKKGYYIKLLLLY